MDEFSRNPGGTGNRSLPADYAPRKQTTGEFVHGLILAMLDRN